MNAGSLLKCINNVKFWCSGNSLGETLSSWLCTNWNKTRNPLPWFVNCQCTPGSPQLGQQLVMTQMGSWQCPARTDWPLQEKGLGRMNSSAHQPCDRVLWMTSLNIRATSNSVAQHILGVFPRWRRWLEIAKKQDFGFGLCISWRKKHFVSIIWCCVSWIFDVCTRFHMMMWKLGFRCVHWDSVWNSGNSTTEMGSAASVEIPLCFPLGCTLKSYSDPMTQDKLKRYCDQCLPHSELDDGEKRPENNKSLQYNTILQLMLLRRKQNEWDEVPDVDLVFTLRNN